jgi:branched-chain amino acid transport system ATP-binding protein
MGDLLRLANVTAGYGATVVIEDVSFSLARGQALAVLGRNGVGKTTLMRTIAGHADLHRGQVLMNDAAIGTAPAWRRARLGMGYVPQERDIFPSLTVAENLAVGARPGEWTLDRIFTLFPSLARRQGHYGNQLSGGEQQMLSIARALALQPTILLLDEPFEGLAPNLVEMLVGVFDELRQSDLSLIMVEQHARLALRMTDQAIALVRGRIAIQRSSRDLLDQPVVLEDALTVRGGVAGAEGSGEAGKMSGHAD